MLRPLLFISILIRLQVQSISDLKENEKLVRQKRYQVRFSERITSLQLEACVIKEAPILKKTGRERPYSALPPIKKLYWCLKLITDKGPELMADRYNHTITKLSPTLDIEWRSIDPDSTLIPGSVCRFQFKGFRREYHLSPDFGAYPTCTTQMSSWRHALLSTKERPTLPYYTVDSVGDSSCPITKLPLKNEEYQACTLKAHTWYLLQMKSTVDLVEKVGHHKFTVRHGGSRFFYTNAKTKFREQRMVTVTEKILNCSVSALVQLKPSWKHDVFMQLYKREKEEIDLLGNLTLRGGEQEWHILNFDLSPQNSSQELCWTIEAIIPYQHATFDSSINMSNTDISQITVTRDMECISLNTLMCNVSPIQFNLCLLLFSSFLACLSR